MCEEFPECVFLVWYVYVCVCVSGYIFFFFCFMGLRCRLGAFLKGARQLSFTAPGGNKQGGKERYLPLLLGKKREVGALLRSNCNSTQLLDKSRNECKKILKLTRDLKASNSSVFVTLAVCVCARV